VPVTITPQDFARWLDCAQVDADEAEGMLVVPREGDFVWHRVSRDVNRVANDDVRLIQPITEAQAAAEQPTPKPEKKAAPRKRAVSPNDEGQGSLF
jgi:hypothetical protein